MLRLQDVFDRFSFFQRVFFPPVVRRVDWWEATSQKGLWAKGSGPNFFKTNNFGFFFDN